MGTTLSTLKPPPGARQKRKRLGRGHGSGLGQTSGKGEKGQLARSGHDVRRGFEGGQMPMQRRLPKRGFKNRFRTEFAPVNVGVLARRFTEGQTVDIDGLKSMGMVPRSAERVKVLGTGELTVRLTVCAHAFSDAARKKIEAAGGTATALVEKNKAAAGKNPKPARESGGSVETEN